MKLHFGSLADKEGMLMDIAAMKREYQRYERWNPRNRLHKEYLEEYQDDYINSVSKKLLEKSKKERFGKFDFQWETASYTSRKQLFMFNSLIYLN